jgi:hypothetical protein
VSQFTGSTFGNYTRTWLIVLGVIFLVVGVGIALALGSIPFAGSGMLLMGGIFAVVGAGLIVAGVVVGRRAAATDQILQTGVAGQATITALTQTGMYLNDQPQISMNLLVSLPNQVPYAATHKGFVPLMLLGRLTSGAPLAVRVDPLDLNKIVVDWGASGFAAGAPMLGAMPMAPSQPMAAAASTASGMDESLGQIQAALAQSGMQAAAPFASAAQGNYTVEQLRAYLRQSGLQATAHVDKLEDSGKVIGDERLYTMEMTLNIPGQTAQKLPASAAMVPVGASHKLFQGMNVPVRYAAENPNLLMVEWDKI